MQIVVIEAPAENTDIEFIQEVLEQGTSSLPGSIGLMLLSELHLHTLFKDDAGSNEKNLNPLGQISYNPHLINILFH